MSLAKTANAKPSDIAYVKVKEVLPSLQNCVTIHEQKGKLCKSNVNYHIEIWVKVGGDKGGSTTKLVAQICNLKQHNSPITTEILFMYKVLDTLCKQEGSIWALTPTVC